jgi:hypothetical protein
MCYDLASANKNNRYYTNLQSKKHRGDKILYNKNSRLSRLNNKILYTGTIGKSEYNKKNICIKYTIKKDLPVWNT